MGFSGIIDSSFELVGASLLNQAKICGDRETA